MSPSAGRFCVLRGRFAVMTGSVVDLAQETLLEEIPGMDKGSQKGSWG